jgi:hypothetical protein
MSSRMHLQNSRSAGNEACTWKGRFWWWW